MFFPRFVHCSVMPTVYFKPLGVIYFFFGFISSHFLPVIGFTVDIYRVNSNPLESGKEMILEEA